MTNSPASQAITLRAGTSREEVQVVKTLKDDGKGKTLVAFIRGSGVSTKWVKSTRIFAL